MVVVLSTLALPTILLALTIVFFASNPVSIFVLLAVMLVGAIYLLTYRETFT